MISSLENNAIDSWRYIRLQVFSLTIFLHFFQQHTDFIFGTGCCGWGAAAAQTTDNSSVYKIVLACVYLHYYGPESISVDFQRTNIPFEMQCKVVDCVRWVRKSAAPLLLSSDASKLDFWRSRDKMAVSTAKASRLDTFTIFRETRQTLDGKSAPRTLAWLKSESFLSFGRTDTFSEDSTHSFLNEAPGKQHVQPLQSGGSCSQQLHQQHWLKKKTLWLFVPKLSSRGQCCSTDLLCC